jgi:2-polyprenyl-3-methyl-5-hydroxy-6-metoxy-1,4-benzoquinol methylase
MNEKEVWDQFGQHLKVDKEFKVGPHYSYQCYHTPRHILFTLARYKFASKLIGKGKSIIEFGCSEGFGTHFLSEFASEVVGVDFDEDAIAFAQKNYANEKLRFVTGNFLEKNQGTFDAAVSFDVIEHIRPENEDEFCRGIVRQLKPPGICFVGTPNILTQQYSNERTRATHINMYSAERLQLLFEKYFHNVFMFTQSDEMILTGFTPTTNYLLAMCTHKKVSSEQ